eukprot:10359118-Alexandrium_andersonii.AAC.1
MGLAAARRDQAALYRGARSLSRSKPNPPKQVRLEDGDFARTPAQAAARWARHFASVHSGQVEDQDSHFARTRPG